jgi:hypothetical protein
MILSQFFHITAAAFPFLLNQSSTTLPLKQPYNFSKPDLKVVDHANRVSLKIRRGLDALFEKIRLRIWEFANT